MGNHNLASSEVRPSLINEVFHALITYFHYNYNIYVYVR